MRVREPQWGVFSIKPGISYIHLRSTLVVEFDRKQADGPGLGWPWISPSAPRENGNLLRTVTLAESYNREMFFYWQHRHFFHVDNREAVCTVSVLARPVIQLQSTRHGFCFADKKT